LPQIGQAPESVATRIPITDDSAGQATPQSRDELLMRIAVKLNNANAIHQAITSSERLRPQLTTPFVAPSSEMEKQIADIWSELLGFEPIGVDDDFFDLGGHSLVAMQVLSRIRSMFDVELSPRLLVTGEFTVASLSKAVLIEQIRQVDAGEVHAILIEVLSDDELRAFSEIALTKNKI
jgi:acyl carrier protein